MSLCRSVDRSGGSIEFSRHVAVSIALNLITHCRPTYQLHYRGQVTRYGLLETVPSPNMACDPRYTFHEMGKPVSPAPSALS